MNYYHIAGGALIALPLITFFVWVWVFADETLYNRDFLRFMSFFFLSLLALFFGFYLLSL